MSRQFVMEVDPSHINRAQDNPTVYDLAVECGQQHLDVR